jgi:hypothetical protein
MEVLAVAAYGKPLESSHGEQRQLGVLPQIVKGRIRADLRIRRD